MMSDYALELFKSAIRIPQSEIPYGRCIVMFTLVTCLALQNMSWAVEVAPRITDREIIEGLVELRGDLKRIEEGQRNIQKRVDDTRKELKDFMLWGFGITFAGMFALIGFVTWDRRSALVPAVAGLRALEEREARVEQILKEIA